MVATGALAHDRTQPGHVGAHRLHRVLDLGTVEERLDEVVDRNGVVGLDDKRAQQSVLGRPAEREDTPVVAHHLDSPENLVPHAHPPQWCPTQRLGR